MQFKTLAVAALSLAGSVFAQCGSAQLATPPNYVSNNGGAVGGMVYFTLDVLWANGISMCGIGVNTSVAASTPINGRVYLHQSITDWNLLTGANNTAADWCPLGDLVGTSNGLNLASPMLVQNGTNSIDLPQGQYLLAVGNGDFNHRYTNGNGANQNVSDGNLTFDGGMGANAIYGTSLFNPRIFNATFDYTPAVSPVTQTPCLVEATCALAGVACGGSGAMVYELFNGTNAWDLSNEDVLFSGSGGTVGVTNLTGSAIVPAVAPDLALGDDAATPLIDVGFGLDAFGVCSSEISVCSNGSIFLGGIGNTTWTESTTTLNADSAARVAAYWDDLQPASGGGASGTIHADINYGTSAVITFSQVALWGSTTNLVTFQVEITPTQILVRYDPASPFASSALVGFYNGVSVGAVPASSDLSGGAVAPVSGGSNLTLTCDSLPLLGGSLDMTLSGTPTIGTVACQIGLTVPGVTLPLPWAPGCSNYLTTNRVILGWTGNCIGQFSIAIPAVTGFLNLPIGCQGYAINFQTFTASASNGLDARVGNF